MPADYAAGTFACVEENMADKISSAKERGSQPNDCAYYTDAISLRDATHDPDFIQPSEDESFAAPSRLWTLISSALPPFRICMMQWSNAAG